MILTRRALLAASGAMMASRLAEARSLVTDPQFLRVVEAALSSAKAAGATYADARIHRRRSEELEVVDDHVESLTDDELYGVGIRVLCNGAWGFASTARVDPSEATRVARVACVMAKANAAVLERTVELAPTPVHVDVWQTPLEKDPFRIPVADKVDVLLAVSQAMRGVKGVAYTQTAITTHREWKLFASSEGALIEQQMTRLSPYSKATAIDSKTGQVATRVIQTPIQGGWEHLSRIRFLEDAPLVAQDAVEKLNAAEVTPGKKDLILAPSVLGIVIHESVGHSTELDRALGLEANYAGTSFATLDKLKKLQFAAPHVTLYADRTTPDALATCGYDDEGVQTQRWSLVENGLLVGYQTTRDQAGWLGEAASRGSSYAAQHDGVPFQRMPNVSLAPGKADLGVKDLISATDDGVYVVGMGSWSIDQQRYNFQFGGQMFYEVKKGKISRPLKNVAFQSNTVDFWRSCEQVAGPKHWELFGTMSDGKGQPVQLNAVSHGSSPSRFRGVSIVNTGKTEGA